MAMDAQDKSQLTALTQMAQKIIYNTERMKQFMKMLGSKQGALIAVQTVMGAIEQSRPVPPQLAPLLFGPGASCVEALERHRRDHPELVEAVVPDGAADGVHVRRVALDVGRVG